jgi:hypothetical protein
MALTMAGSEAVSKVTDMAVEVTETAVVSQAVARIAVVEVGAGQQVAAMAMMEPPARLPAAEQGVTEDTADPVVEVLAEAVMAAQAVAGLERQDQLAVRRPTEATLTVRAAVQAEPPVQ